MILRRTFIVATMLLAAWATVGPGSAEGRDLDAATTVDDVDITAPDDVERDEAPDLTAQNDGEAPEACPSLELEPELLCGSDSDCAGFGRCRSGSCGHCGSDSDCGGHGRCRNSRCGSCGSDSDCRIGRCRNGACNSCGSDSDCNGYGRCRSGQCGSCGSDSDCRIGRCRNSQCGACGSDSDCAGGRCRNSRCSNSPQ